MSWDNEYIIVRIDNSGIASVVHQAHKIKDARYWLQYIAEAGDAIFKTPKHPKYEGGGEPVYYMHLVKRGQINQNEDEWKSAVLSEGQSLQLPA